MYDFAGPYTVNVNNFAFGRVLKAVPLEVDNVKMKGAIFQSNCAFQKKNHDLILNNCHSHVAQALHLSAANGSSNWTGWRVFWLVLRRGRYVDRWAVFQAYIGSVLLYAVILLVFLL